MAPSIVTTGKRIFVALPVAAAVTFVAVVITPPCSDIGYVDNPIYCLGGLGTQKIFIFLGLSWIGISVILGLRDAASIPFAK